VHETSRNAILCRAATSLPYLILQCNCDLHKLFCFIKSPYCQYHIYALNTVPKRSVSPAPALNLVILSTPQVLTRQATTERKSNISPRASHRNKTTILSRFRNPPSSAIQAQHHHFYPSRVLEMHHHLSTYLP
jgi:hypothetical protein